MKDLRKELLNEKMQVHSNKRAIQFLQRVLDGYPVTKREFIDTMVVKKYLVMQVALIYKY
jgi:hypothetical protein